MHGLDTSNVSSRVEPSGIWAYVFVVIGSLQINCDDDDDDADDGHKLLCVCEQK